MRINIKVRKYVSIKQSNLNILYVIYIFLWVIQFSTKKGGSEEPVRWV